MKFLKMKLRYVIILMASVALISCSKAEDGAIGPIGPTGPTGQIGAAGPAGQDGADGLNGGVDGQDGANGADGADGQDGATGTANVIYSPLITIEANDWDVSLGGKNWFYGIEAPELTQEIFEKGVVLVYSYSAADGGAYFLVPDGTYTNWVRVNTIGIRRVQENQPYTQPGDRQFRYVLIPGGVSTSGKSSIDYKKMTYEQVMDHFGLEE